MEWLASRRHALLADEMGLGKSAQAIVAADRIAAERILVVCPAVARVNWMREFEKFSTRALSISVLTAPPSRAPITGRGAGTWICSYDYATAHVQSLNADLLILDEAHYLKNPSAKRTHAVLGHIAHTAECTWALTGTPAPNNAAELWPLLYTCGLTPLSHAAFITRYCVQVWNGERLQIVGNQNVEELRALLTPFMIRRTKAEVMPDLPPIHFTTFVVEPGDVCLENYFADRDAVKELHLVRQELAVQAAMLEGIAKMTDGVSSRRLGALEGLVTSTATLRRYMGAQKVEPLADLVISEIDAGAYNKLVIFAMHRVVIEELRLRLRKFNPVTLYGGTPPTTRQANIDRFQKDPKCKIFIGQVQAAGTAINLTAAHHVLFAEYDWVPATNAQAAMRCHRIGQTQPVFVRFAVAAGAIDEIVLKVVRRKTKELAAIFDPVDIFA